MNPLSKQLSIAVIGAPSCGKSYLLFDLIHAFHVLGYRPKELPLDYPYSSFGTFFYDTFNADTGGMRGTEVYACRPENHYGAHLSNRRGRDLWVNFLNIPGEAFKNLEAIKNFFVLKDRIEHIKPGLFWLVRYEAPSGHELKLIVPSQGFNLDSYPAVSINSWARHVDYMQWEYISALISTGDYHEQGRRKSVSGKYILSHLNELMTDSVLLSLKAVWPMITGLPEDLDYYEENVLKHFYPLCYCQNATDMIICDNLSAQESAAVLSQEVGHYLDSFTGHAPNVYLAFRNADMLLGEKAGDYKKALAATIGQGEVSRRNRIYTTFLAELMPALDADDGGWIGKEKAEHIVLGVGRGMGFAFRELLNKSLVRNQRPTSIAADTAKPLTPHVFFTATPIDSGLAVYQNDPGDVTRFYLDNGKIIKSFVRETSHDMAQHFCWGSLQLLIDILTQNACVPTNIKADIPETLNYFFSNQ